MNLEFAGQSGRDTTNPAMNSSRLVNCFREPLTSGGFGIRAVPGMALFAEFNRTFLRDMRVYKDNLLAICGGRLFEVSAAGALRDLGGLTQSAEAGISVNTGIATIVSGGVYSTWDGATLAPVSVDGPVGSVAYLGGYTVLTELGGRRFWWSDLADPTTVDPLNFASAEITEGDLIRALVVMDTLLLFKADGFEQWGVTGQANELAFQRISGAMIETGLAGYALCCTIPNGAAFVGDDGRVHVWSAGSMRPISTPPVEAALRTSGPQSVFYYALRGHGFICVAFESGAAWCYDVALGEWHEREEDNGAWTARASVFFAGSWRVGSAVGKVATLNGVITDFDKRMVRRAVSAGFGPISKPFTIARLEAQSRRATDLEGGIGPGVILEDSAGPLGSGTAILGDDGYDSGAAHVSLRVSRDGGMTFGLPKPRAVGLAGEFFTRLIWRALGQFRRQAVIELSVSCPTDLVVSANVEVDAA